MRPATDPRRSRPLRKIKPYPAYAVHRKTVFETGIFEIDSHSLTGMLNKRDSAFHRSLKAITQPETLQLALDRIPRTDTHRRTLVEQRMMALTTAATSSAPQ